MKRISMLVFALFVGAIFAQDDAESLYKEGLDKLRQAQSDHSALVPATKLLTKAAELYEAKGNESKITEINSCLYWAKKKFNLADTENIKTDTRVVQKLEAVAKTTNDAKTMLEKAEGFARANPESYLLIAIRYFEIADRFPETVEGRKAMGLSLGVMSKIGTEKIELYHPASTDGKVFIQSEPAGASILLVTDEGKRDTGKKTPSIVELPKGKQKIELTLKKYKNTTLEVIINGGINKPDRILLDIMTMPVDIIFEAGWKIYCDKKFIKHETPSTIELPLGTHEIALVKEGFIDIFQKTVVVEDKNNKIEIAVKPTVGRSNILSLETVLKNEENKAMPGKYMGVHPAWTPMKQVVTLNSDGTFKRQDGEKGKWKYENETLTMAWDNWSASVLEKVNDRFRGITGNNYVFIMEKIKGNLK